MDEEKPKYEFEVQAKCPNRGYGPGFTYLGDKLPDDRTFQEVIENAKKALCLNCIGQKCEAWRLANATVAELKSLLIPLSLGSSRNIEEQADGGEQNDQR